MCCSSARHFELSTGKAAAERLRAHNQTQRTAARGVVWAAKFSQDQVGHSHAATTAIYISVGDDFKDRLVRAAIDEQTGADRRSNTASGSEHAAASDGVWAWVLFGA